MESQGQNRFYPKFGAALRTGNMDMAAAFLPAVKEKAIWADSHYSGRHRPINPDPLIFF
jgi:hypothetical protein